MTYCCGILVRDGLVMIADTRTNAGLDNISVFRKLHVFPNPGERIMAIAVGRQPVAHPVGHQQRQRRRRESRDRRARDADERADHVSGGAAHRPRHPHRCTASKARCWKSSDVKFDLSFLFGGQIKGERMRLFMIYSAGNFIECTVDTPYLQIGEHKYGKPVLDRAITYDIDLYDALKIGLDLGRFHHALQSQRRHAARYPGGAARRLRRPNSTIASSRASPISTICASAGRRRCAPPTTTFRARPTPKSERERARDNKGGLRHGSDAENRPRHRRRHRHRPRRRARPDEDRLHRRAGRTAQGQARRSRQGRRRPGRQEPRGAGRHRRPGLDQGAVRQDQGGVRPARCAVQQCRRRRAGGADRGSALREMESGRRHQPARHRSCAPRKRSAS